MTIPVRKQKVTTAAQPDKPYFGWTEQGSFFRSAAEIDNAVTRFVRRMVPEIRARFLSPAEVALELKLQPEYVRRAFPTSESTSPDGWSWWLRPWNWHAAGACNSAEETLKRSGPPEWKDPNALERWYEGAERERGYACRFADTPKQLSVSGITFGAPPRLHCRVHGEMFPRSSDSG